MIVVDSSALIAILFEEPEGSVCTAALEAASARVISCVNYVETGTVLAGRLLAKNTQSKGKRARGELTKAMEVLDEFLDVLHVEIAPIDSAMARAALSARLAFGQGFGTRGGLNFGDCFAYALATQHGVPLLYVGDDFTRTGITPALKTSKNLQTSKRKTRP